MLAGESVLPDKAVPSGEADGTGPSEATTPCAGTIVVRGRGVAQVTATGKEGALGRIAELLDTRPRPHRCSTDRPRWGVSSRWSPSHCAC
jgi:magnesium-transporting ATPase (P-type)